MTAKLYSTIKLNSGLPSGNCNFRKVRTVIVKMFFKQQQLVSHQKISALNWDWLWLLTTK